MQNQSAQPSLASPGGLSGAQSPRASRRKGQSLSPAPKSQGQSLSPAPKSQGAAPIDGKATQNIRKRAANDQWQKVQEKNIQELERIWDKFPQDHKPLDILEWQTQLARGDLNASQLRKEVGENNKQLEAYLQKSLEILSATTANSRSLFLEFAQKKQEQRGRGDTAKKESKDMPDTTADPDKQALVAAMDSAELQTRGRLHADSEHKEFTYEEGKDLQAAIYEWYNSLEEPKCDIADCSVIDKDGRKVARDGGEPVRSRWPLTVTVTTKAAMPTPSPTPTPTSQARQPQLIVSGAESVALNWMGIYTQTTISGSSHNADRPIYENIYGQYLFYWDQGNQKRWIMGSDYGRNAGVLFAVGDVRCPTDASGWQVYVNENEGWQRKYSISIQKAVPLTSSDSAATMSNRQVAPLTPFDSVATVSPMPTVPGQRQTSIPEVFSAFYKQAAKAEVLLQAAPQRSRTEVDVPKQSAYAGKGQADFDRSATMVDGRGGNGYVGKGKVVPLTPFDSVATVSPTTVPVQRQTSIPQDSIAILGTPSATSFVPASATASPMTSARNQRRPSSRSPPPQA